MQTLKQLTKEIQELKTKRNEGILSIFALMVGLQKTENWKNDTFYTGTDNNIKEWKEAKFSFILRHVAGWTMTRFLSIQAIVTMENGRDIFLKYGYENSVALKNMSKKERPQVLAAVESHIESLSIIPNFYDVIYKVFPGRRQVRQIADGSEAKANNLLAENKKLKKRLEELQTIITNLTEENKKLREMVVEKLLKVGSN